MSDLEWQFVAAVALVAAAVVIFVAAVRVGMLLGRTLDRWIETRAAVDRPATRDREERAGE